MTIPPRESDPKPLLLLELGVAMAVPEYVLGVARHEGLHALFATAFGAKVTYVHVLPSESDGHFYFGQTGWHGNLTREQNILVYLAPKMGDLVGLSAYAMLDLTGNIPKNKYAQLSLLVLATGMWTDFAFDFASTSAQNDSIKAYNLLGADNEASRLPYRLLHGSLAIGAAIPLIRGYVRLFRSSGSSPMSVTRPRVEAYMQGDTIGVRGAF